VEEICRRARTLDIPVCIDGPHAVGMLPLNLKKLDCDYYTASCHKWLSAPFGSGFLYVAPRQQKRIQPAIVSWGGSIGGRQPSWKDEFNWLGTRNPAAFLATADALRFLQSSVSSFPERIAADPEPLGDLTLLDEFRNIAHKLIDLAVTELGRSVGTKPLVKDTVAWCGSMISLALPAPSLPEADHVGKAGQRHPLQDWLWENHQIEIPVVRWRDQLLIRVSGHLYNSVDDIFTLSAALREYLN
ncbi:MAG: aminotransferase class V-fold PLP-dependent enzyme, partial [Planctomycetota bacterium]|nr:aminotransferase class V-fold PLP-dependent enzyme [Planctomycetota bacterium]